MTIHGLPAPQPYQPSQPPRTDPAAAAQGTPQVAREPALWQMLSQAERAFFLAPSGSMTLGYGPGGATTEAAPVVGQQLDVKA